MKKIRSEVFAAMFSQPMKESTDNIVKVVDADPMSLENFIRSEKFFK